MALQNTQPDPALLFALWGKTNEREKGYTPEKWTSHPAICHMIDVAFVAQVWLDANPFIMKKFCELAPAIDREPLRHIILTLAALHDLGKLHAYFQAKSPIGWNRGYAGRMTQPEKKQYQGFDHGLATARILYQLRRDLPHWQAWSPAIRAAAAHHGSLYDRGKVETPASDCPTISIEKPYVLAAVHLLCDLFQTPEQLPAMPGSNGFLMFLTGFISVADWFGSNSTLFPFTSLRTEQQVRDYYAALDPEPVRQALHNAGLLPTYRAQQQDFTDLFEFMQSDADLRPLQARARDINFGGQPGAEMVVVEAPMGMGKTEIALYLASRAITSGTADGLYFALPTQASSNALLKRIQAFAHRIAAEDGSISLMLAHGGRNYNQSFAELIVRAGARGNCEFNRNNTPSEVIAPDWLLSSKRVLLAAVGVGTIDQAMLGALSVRHAFVRLFGLAGRVVVFDEIHAYDAYMNEVILALLRWLQMLGAKVILLSATLPGVLRRELLAPYCATQPTDAARAPYPQMLHVQNGTLLPPYTPAPSAPTPGNDTTPVVTVTTVETPLTGRTARGAALAVELARKGGAVVWIRNTVREAQEAWQMLADQCRAENIELDILHARYVRADRNAKESSLLRRLGKDAREERPSRFILIATQVIEQSVDIDFDAMISDLAPIDLLLQRVGRLWRHHRPGQRHAHTAPELHVLLPTAEERHTLNFGSSALVYDAETLLRTAVYLMDTSARTWTMPDACRDLVSAVYDRDASQWTAEQMAADPTDLDKARRTRDRRTKTMRSGAQRISLRGTSGREPEPAMALAVLEDNDKGEYLAITTRHGMYSATVVLLRQQQGRLVFAGAPDVGLSPLPDGTDTRHRLAFEEAVALSSVSFPWYERQRLAQRPELPDEARALAAWWQEHHPYDNRLVLPVDDSGAITHERFTARYAHQPDGTAAEGLVIEERFAPDAAYEGQATQII